MIVFTVDTKAATDGGAKAGQYLDSIGVTDLRKLNAGQWEKFCCTLVAEAFKAGLDSYMIQAEKDPPF